MKPGDLVQLKSGGPTMTVDSVNLGYANEIKCAWFEGTVLKKNYFSPDSLTTPDPNAVYKGNTYR